MGPVEQGEILVGAVTFGIESPTEPEEGKQLTPQRKRVLTLGVGGRQMTEGRPRHHSHLLFSGCKRPHTFEQILQRVSEPQKDLRKITGEQGVWGENIQESEALQLTMTELPRLGTSRDSDCCLDSLGLGFPTCTRKGAEIASRP